MLRFTGSQRVGHDGATDLNLNLNDQPRQHIKKQKHYYYFANKGPYGQNYGFSSVMYRCKSCIKKKG